MPEIKWVGSPNYTEGRNGKKIIAIVNHITAGLMPGTLSWMQNPAAKVSAHYLVTRQGEIYQMVKDENTAYHAGIVNKPNWILYDGTNPNRYTIGIEHEGYKNQGGDGMLTEAQYQATLWLHRHLIGKWDIKITDKHIVGHCRIDSVNRTNCPGRYSPWERMFGDLKNGVIDMVLEKWMIEGGQEALRELAKKKLVNNPEDWSSKDKLAETVPLYLFWMMIQRLAKMVEGK